MPYVSAEEALSGSQQITIQDKIKPSMNLENLLLIFHTEYNHKG